MFHGLQLGLRKNLTDLPTSCNPRLKTAIIDAHRKLSEYYWKFDSESPFYIWAAMLEPRIMYDSLAENCVDEPGLELEDLEKARDDLRFDRRDRDLQN